MTSQPEAPAGPRPESIIRSQKGVIDQLNDNRVVLFATIDEMREEMQQVVQAYEGAIASIMSLANEEDRAKMQAHLDTLNGKPPVIEPTPDPDQA